MSAVRCGWLFLDVQTHLVRAQGVRERERVDAHGLQPRVGLEPKGSAARYHFAAGHLKELRLRGQSPGALFLQ